MTPYRTRRALPACCLILALTFAAQAQDAPLDTVKDIQEYPDGYSVSHATMELTLSEAIDRAIQENLSLEIERLNPDIQEAEIGAEISVFDPVLDAEARHVDGDVPASGFLSGAGVGSATDPFGGDPVLGGIQSENTDATVGLSQYLKTGTRYELRLDYLREETTSQFAGFNPAYEWNATAGVSQSLLEGFNAIPTRAFIKIAENERLSAELGLRQAAMDVALETINRYWEVVFAEADLSIKRQSLDLALDLLRIKRAEVEAGVEAPIEIVSASAGVAQREQALIVAENNIEFAQDLLRRVINVGTDPEAWQQPIEPADNPVFSVFEPDLEASIAMAMDYRPLLEIARLGIENSELGVQAAKNRLLPTLDVGGGVTWHGLGENPGNSFDTMAGSDYYSWNVGLMFNYPLGNNAARSQYRVAKLREEQSTLQLEDARQAVIQDVRTAVRELVNSRKRIEAAVAARILARERLDSIEKTYGVGLATAFDVLEFQEDFTQAQVDEIRAIIDYIENVARLERAEGTILQRHGLEVYGN